MIKRIVLGLVGLAFFLFPLDYLKLTEVKAGMEGEGKTIFKGTAVETFRFRVLGIMENVFPKKNLILVELFSPELKDGGVISGMSGSPVYIEGKLIGSVSYGFSFSKKPIAGVTPIEDILQIADHQAADFSVDISSIKVGFDSESVAHVRKWLQEELARRFQVFSSPLVSPIRLIAFSSGIRREIIQGFLPALAPMQDFSISSQVKKNPAALEKMFSLAPADAVAIPLVRGDFEYSASGTVTCVDNKRVYIFGHPFFNLGHVDFPLHRAEVISVVPSYESSFRLASTKHMIGTVQQDRNSAVLGELGAVPVMIPLQVFLPGRNKRFSVELVHHPLLTPILSSITLLNVFASEFKQYGVQSLQVNGRIFIENEENILISNLFSGLSSFDEFAELIMAIQFFLLNNTEKSIRIQKIDFEITGIEHVKRTELENVLLEKTDFSPGELIPINLVFQDERKVSWNDQIVIKAPNLKPDTDFYLLAGDAQAMTEFDSKSIKSEYFPDRVSILIRAINNLRKNNRLYLKLFVPSEGIFYRGYEYPYLPFSLNNVLNYGAQSREQGSVVFSTLGEYQMEVPGVMVGKKVFKLKIKARQKDE